MIKPCRLFLIAGLLILLTGLAGCGNDPTPTLVQLYTATSTRPPATATSPPTAAVPATQAATANPNGRDGKRRHPDPHPPALWPHWRP
jgi:hypothetical protein